MDKSKNRGNMGVYSSLVAQKKKISGQVDNLKNTAKRSVDKVRTSVKAKNANLRPLPDKQPARFFAHFRWERIRAYWFSAQGLRRIGKIFAACVLFGIIGVGALFVYYKNQLKEIELNDLTIAETVNTYLDRNGIVLWEDKGDSDYRLVVDEDQISTYVRQATVALEDRKFYSHPGVDLAGLVRAAISTLTGNGVQGGSTLTQQLIKQVYFANEATSANRGGISRKIKELILSIELEKMYSKEQIITMYLNQSPYGGRRNGIESAAQTYFGKTAKDLTLAESALLAAIPNNPGVLNPYNTYGNSDLIERQHRALDVMVELGYITQEECNAAKEVDILDQILPEANQFTDIKAPHFVMEVKSYLEDKYGFQTMRQGGYTIKTTLDYNAQQIAEQAIANGAALTTYNGSDNLALVSVDVESSQVIAMVGSIDWSAPVYGEVNVTTANVEPGSTIKPILDYAPLFSDTERVWGPGSILYDEDIDKYYCVGTSGPCAMGNAIGRYVGEITIRDSLANSLNIGAVKALAMVGIDNALDMAHALGDQNYCVDSSAGLSMAIGSGCAVKMVEHANAYATIARGGKFKEYSYVLEVKDSSGKVIELWKDPAGTEVIDEQVAYEISSVLSDADARSKYTFTNNARDFGFVIGDIWTASKTGTTTTANSAIAKDSLMVSYSTALATVVWNGNHDGSGLGNASNNPVRRVVHDFMGPVHHEVYAPEGKWQPGDQPKRPAGIHEETVMGRTDIYPSWYSKEKSGVENKDVEFNAINGLIAAECTPTALRIPVSVSVIEDHMTGTLSVFSTDERYSGKEKDTCDGTMSGSVGSDAIQISPVTSITGRVRRLDISFDQPDGAVFERYTIMIDGVMERSGHITTSTLLSGISLSLTGTESVITVTVTDTKDKTYTTSYVVAESADAESSSSSSSSSN